MDPQKNAASPLYPEPGKLRDIDDSAFRVDDDIPPQPNRTMPAPQPGQIRDIMPPTPPPPAFDPRAFPTLQMRPPVAAPPSRPQPVTPAPAPSFQPPPQQAPPQPIVQRPIAPPQPVRQLTPPPAWQPPRPQPVSAASTQILTGPATFPGHDPQPLNPNMPVQHISDDIAARIAEKPQLNSSDIQHQIEKGDKMNRIKNILSIAAFLAGIVVAAFLINQFVFQSYFVDGTSMAPTLQHNDRLIISKTDKTLAAIQSKPYIPARGQIVILDSKLVAANGDQEQLIKRVIGLPGEKLRIADGVVTVFNNDSPEGFNVDQSLGLTLDPTSTSEPLEITIPENEVFVMGDNRGENQSYDSRMFGPVESKDLEGRLWARVLPVNQAKIYD